MAITDKDIHFCAVDDLLLDPENPRLPESLTDRSQKAMINHIARKGAIEDLMSAIGENGFFRGEALVTYRNKSDPPGKLRVIEGNRRLTAVKLLRDPTLCKEKPSIAELSQTARQPKPRELPVVIFATRKEVLPYLGSRHIVGVRQWEPLAKARYMRQLLDSFTDKKQDIKKRYRDIAESIGSHKRTDYIKTNLDALAVFDVLESNGFFGIKGLDESTVEFGTLYTALGYGPVAEYVGLAKKQKDGSYDFADPIVNPKVLKRDRVGQLSRWMFEADDEGNKVVSESRDIPKLAKVLASPEAREQLESGATLDTAYTYTSGISEELTANLQNSKKYLKAAVSVAPNSVPNQALLKLSDEVAELADAVRALLDAKANKATRR